MKTTIDVQISNLVKLIKCKYLSTSKNCSPIDLAQKNLYFTLDVISDLAFGQSFGYLKEDGDVFDYIKITNSYIPVMLVLANVPLIADLLHSQFFRRFLPKESDKLGVGAFIE
jgi:hypothetical protein